MPFIDRVLQEPSYQWANEKGELSVPSTKELFQEAFRRINVFQSKKNWMPFLSWSVIAVIAPAFALLVFEYATWKLSAFAFFYGMLFMSTHGTIWYHRYCTHKAYKFKHPFWRFVTQNLVIKTVPEETYVISHHVHHAKSDLPGDPYNPRGGFLYCMLADVNHQGIAKDLDKADYNQASLYLKDTGVKRNSYAQYQKYGSVSSPWQTLLSYLLNWIFWYGAFYSIGVLAGGTGHGLALSAFTAAVFWFVLVRAFNYTGHGGGVVKHEDGVDYDRTNLSINQVRPGYFSGEWHNNHHLYPKSARAGFLKYQLDTAWIYIWIMRELGAVHRVQDDKEKFLSEYYRKQKTKDKEASERRIRHPHESVEGKLPRKLQEQVGD